ncbi:MAG: hypothetical protein GXP30_01730 [Verrucomicrobia bacterium]|nr:hypothetical protein [Verrucomicrobiota bacterium]
MKISYAFIFIVGVIFSISCGDKKENLFLRVQAGQTKEDVKRILGEPYEILAITKTKGPIWGPEEEFWDKIPNDTALTMWRYKNATGNLNLYFKEDEKRLFFKAFAPVGVVYEAEH